MIKRALDILLSGLGLIFLIPCFGIVAILIKLDSKGPVFFRHTRIGKDGKPFSMLKFRTMIEAKHWTGASISPRNDPRVTRIGAILRRFKINEFPQLVNVLKGEMSFVGPRPEVPEFVKLYDEEQKRALSVRPGIVGPSQIHMRNEEEIFAQGEDPTQFYIEHIMPRKLKLDLEYIDQRSFLKDIGYILLGVQVTITGAVTKRHLFENAEQIVLFICDVFACTLSYFLSYFLRIEGEFATVHRVILLHTLPYLVGTRMMVLTYFGLYSSLVQYFSVHELLRMVKAITISSVIIILLTFLVGQRSHPRSVFAIDWFVVIFLLAGYRLVYKYVRENITRSKNTDRANVLIYGAGNTGDLALRFLRMRGSCNVVAFVDDDPKKIRKSFQGVKVLGNRYDIAALAGLYRIDQLCIARRNLSPEDLGQIKALCEKANVQCEVFALAN